MKSGQFIQWQDLFVVVDDGAIPLARYNAIEGAMQEQAKLFPLGISCLVILPSGARPPPDDVQRAVKEMLTRLAPCLSCLAYVIEGVGFKAVAARASLVGMKIFSSRPYPIYVETSMQEGLTKVLSHLARGKTVTSDVNVIMKVISDARMVWATQPPAVIRASEVISK
jgi:hypothetical protein